VPAATPSVSFDDIVAARDRIAQYVLRTPLVRLNVDAPNEIWLKLENLQPIGSFKLRGALNRMLSASSEDLEEGVLTASAGNMAQGVAWGSKRLGVPCSVVVPDHAPAAKVDAIERLGGRVSRVPFNDWWQILVDHQAPGHSGMFIHPVSDPFVVAGNGTIGLEIAEDLPAVDSVIVPYGGGGLSSGIATALQTAIPSARVYAAEVDTASPFAASLDAGTPTPFDYVPSFVDGIGGRTVLAEMWPLTSALLAGSKVVSLGKVAEAIRLLVARNRVVAEGAGAASVAAALASEETEKTIVCIVSGGNIDPLKLATILSGDIP